MKKRIVCFGDSNTWGYDGNSGARFDENTRYTGVLAKLLGPNYTVIEEGQNGRTTAWDDPVEGEKNGLKYLVPCLESHAPIDVLIIMLGTNDLKNRFNVCPQEIAMSAGRLVRVALNKEYGRDGVPPRVILTSPIHIGQLEKSRFAYMFRESTPEDSRRLPEAYRQIAMECSCEFMDASLYAQPDESDQVHMSAQGHEALARAFAKKIQSL